MDRGIPHATLRRSAPATPASVARLRSAVADHLIAAGIVSLQVQRIKLAVSEAISNAVLHAYQGAAAPGDVHVAVEILRGAVHVTVSDDGGGMSPRMDSPGAGLGLPIIASVATSFEVSHRERSGTQLRMSFAAEVAEQSA
jgi:serine/threonine-protein kinase RsbW/stage II sporulation protein AB (anti-sigma F factor)